MASNEHVGGALLLTGFLSSSRIPNAVSSLAGSATEIHDAANPWQQAPEVKELGQGTQYGPISRVQVWLEIRLCRGRLLETNKSKRRSLG